MITRGNARDLYWTFPQQLAHATVNGADRASRRPVRVGHDLRLRARHRGLACSSPARGFLDDGDTVTLRGRAGTIELGEVRGTIVSGRDRRDLARERERVERLRDHARRAERQQPLGLGLGR